MRGKYAGKRLLIVDDDAGHAAPAGGVFSPALLPVEDAKAVLQRWTGTPAVLIAHIRRSPCPDFRLSNS